MTVLGFILLIVVVAALASLLNEGARDALRIDRWRDLWHREG